MDPINQISMLDGFSRDPILHIKCLSEVTCLKGSENGTSQPKREMIVYSM